MLLGNVSGNGGEFVFHDIKIANCILKCAIKCIIYHFFGIFRFLQCFSQQDGSNLFNDLILRLRFVAEFVRAPVRGCRLHRTNISCLRSALAHVYATVLTTVNVSILFLIDDLQIYIAHEPFIWCSSIFFRQLSGALVDMRKNS